MSQAFAAHLHKQWGETAKGQTPGAVVRVTGPAGPVFDFAAGNERADRDTAMNADSTFHIASVGKAMTATLILQLIEAGRLAGAQLDRPVAEIAELADLVVHIPVLRLEGITLRRLMNHTSGLRDAFSDDGDLTAAQNGGRPAPRFSRTPGEAGAPVRPGADTEAVLRERGFDAARIAALRTAGAI